MARIVEVVEGRIQIPEDWLERWNHPAQLVLEETNARLIIRPISSNGWDEVFRNKIRASVITESEEVCLERSDIFL